MGHQFSYSGYCCFCIVIIIASHSLNQLEASPFILVVLVLVSSWILRLTVKTMQNDNAIIMCSCFQVVLHLHQFAQLRTGCIFHRDQLHAKINHTVEEIKPGLLCGYRVYWAARYNQQSERYFVLKT